MNGQLDRLINLVLVGFAATSLIITIGFGAVCILLAQIRDGR